MRNMKRNMKQHLVGIVAVAILLAGCDIKDAIYNTPYPEQGTLTLTTDWSGIGEGLTTPTSYTVTAAGYSATLSGTTNRVAYLFEPGTLRVDVYNMPEQIAVNGTVATVAATSGNANGVDGFIHNVPGWLFTSSGEVRVEKDKEHTYTAVMQQQVRKLTLIIEPAGGTTNRIERIEGYLSGAAASLDFVTGTHATPSNVELLFARINEGADTGKWLATVRLLGIAGEQQKLNAKIYFTDGGPETVALDSDLTTDLAAFNADKRKSLTLGGKVVETPVVTGFAATINKWIPVTGIGTAD